MNSLTQVSIDALLTAASYGYLEAVSTLIGEKVELAGYYNQIARGAAANGQLDTIEFMNDNNMFTYAGYNAYGAAYKAAENGQLDVLKFLCNIGVKMDMNQGVILMRVAEQGYLDVLKFLHQSQRFDLSISDNITLQTAITNGHTNIVRYLYDNGIDFSVLTKHSYAVFEAIKYGHEDTLDYLKSKGIYADSEYVVDVLTAFKDKYQIQNDTPLFIYADRIMYQDVTDENETCYQLLEIDTENICDMETGLNMDNMDRFGFGQIEYEAKVFETESIETEYDI